MHTELWQRAGTVFAELAELPPEQRAARMAQACGDDAVLRDAVARLLRAHDSTDEAIAAIDRALSAAISADTAPEPALASFVGPFQLVRELGAGGMGRVYLAERTIDGARLPVALKLPAASALDQEFRERLRAERRALAGLEHPNIARLVDAGELPDGRPYFAMEYVDGLPLTQACDEGNATLEARLLLFADVCAAVQHAHQALLVHRDIKPANVLLGRNGVVKLLDFGIAKPLLLDAEAAQATADGRRFFSPAAAAPEQVQGRLTGVGTDVYSLGVLLYTLLAGALPYEVTGLAHVELIRRIVDHVPVLMSERVRRLARNDPAAAIEAARRRGLASPQEHANRLAGDLDAIVARCLRKEPAARYGSAQALADDVRAVLAHRPISIRSGERWYRATRFLRRHRLPVGLAAVAAALTIAFAVSSVLQARRLAEERDVAREQRRRAEFERNRAEQVVAFLIGLFRANDPLEARGEDLKASVLLERARQRLATELRDDDAIRASLLGALADIYAALSRYPEAQRAADEAAALREKLPGEGAALALSRLQQARVSIARGEPPAALIAIAHARVLRESLRLEQPGEPEVLALEAQALAGIGKLDQAIAASRREYALRHAQASALDPLTIEASRRLSSLLQQAGQPDAASEVRDESLLRRLAALTDPGDPRRVGVLREHALSLERKDRLAEARGSSEEALALALRVYGERHMETALVLNTLGSIVCRSGDMQAGLAYLDRSLAVRRALFGDEHPRVAMAEFNVGAQLLHRERDARGALPYLQRAVAIGTRAFPETHTSLNIFRVELGSALRELGEFAQAHAVLDAARVSFEKLKAPRGLRLARVRGELACIDRAQAATEAARRDAWRQLEDAIAVLAAYRGETRADLARLSACESH